MKKEFFNGPLVLLLLLFIAACNNQPKEQTPPSADSTSVSKKTSIPGAVKEAMGKEGEEKTKYANGVIQTLGNYKAGKRDGQWYSWYDTGKPWSETYFENGLKNGGTKTWYENGKLRYTGQFKDDVETGLWTYYNQEGKQERVVDYSKK